MKQAKTSNAWMKEHVSDFFVKQARKEGYRSRAAYKLIEIHERDKLFKPGMTVVDLGAAPGSWSQVAAKKVGRNGKIVALDLLEMASISGVEFIQGDFREDDILNELKIRLESRLLDLVISDMSPNVSGIKLSDQARSMHLAELALEFAIERLSPGGNFLVKVFQGYEFDQYLLSMRASFDRVIIRKPKASRDRSKELYLLGSVKKK